MTMGGAVVAHLRHSRSFPKQLLEVLSFESFEADPRFSLAWIDEFCIRGEIWLGLPRIPLPEVWLSAKGSLRGDRAEFELRLAESGETLHSDGRSIDPPVPPYCVLLLSLCVFILFRLRFPDSTSFKVF